MRFALLVGNGVVLAGISWLIAFGPSLRASELLPARATPELGDIPALETRAGLETTAPNVAALASAYLDRDQPGLATAVIDKAPREIQARPEIAQLKARALFRRGHAREALAVAQQARTACAETDCSAWIAAKTARQVAFLEQVVAAGIDDPRSDPTATRAAYERSTREVRLVAMR
ncbi:MAG: hypothetical protein IT372_22825 [Polyangiaceae bacterium]|nr:hypothetical protein [Polyangiaceae bacterium]